MKKRTKITILLAAVVVIAVWTVVYTYRWCTAVSLLPAQITDLIERDRRPR